MSSFIYQLSTPTHKFSLPFSKDFVADIRLTYKQGENIVTEKSGKDINFIADKEFRVELTQEETKGFNNNDVVKIQAVVLTKNGKVMPSKVITKVVYEVLNSEVLS